MINEHKTDMTLSNPPAEILHTSNSLVWKDVIVEKRYHAGGEEVFPGSSSHLICLAQGAPVAVQQTCNGQSFQGILAPGNVQIIPSGAESTWRHQEDAEYIRVLLTPALIQKVAEDDQQHIQLFAHLHTSDTRIEHICSALLTELLEGGPSGRLYVEGLTTALAAHLIRAYTHSTHALPETTKGLSASQLQTITALIEDRLGEDLGLTRLSSEIGLSLSHFSSLFRASTGLPPHTYIMQRRLERAQYLLRSTELSVGEIATSVGFSDHSHLTHHMRKVMGITPSCIRKQLH